MTEAQMTSGARYLACGCWLTCTCEPQRPAPVRQNPTRNYSREQMVRSLQNWAGLERGKSTDPRGYGSDDRRVFQGRADLLDTVIAELGRLDE